MKEDECVPKNGRIVSTIKRNLPLRSVSMMFKDQFMISPIVELIDRNTGFQNDKRSGKKYPDLYC